MEIYGVIYSATNKINGKKYIGQTTTSVNRRKSSHLHYANNGSEIYFHRAIRKHGKKNFKWEIIDEAYGIDDLNKKEIKWIEHYDSFYNGYNTSIGGQTGVSDNPDETSLMRGGRPFFVFDLNGNFIVEAISQKQLAKDLNLGYRSINLVLNDKKQSTKGYTMIFKDAFNEDRLKEKIKIARNREFCVFNKNDLSFVGKWDDKKQCSEDTGVYRSTITNKLETNNYGNRCDYLFYYFKDIPEDLKPKIKDVI